MNVKELRDKLNELIEQGNGEMEVVAPYPSGDYWRSTLAGKIDSVGSAAVNYSAYHNCLKIVEDDHRIEHESYQEVIVLE